MDAYQTWQELLETAWNACKQDAAFTKPVKFYKLLRLHYEAHRSVPADGVLPDWIYDDGFAEKVCLCSSCLLFLLYDIFKPNQSSYAHVVQPWSFKLAAAVMWACHEGAQVDLQAIIGICTFPACLKLQIPMNACHWSGF